MKTHGLDVNDEGTRETMGRALRTTYGLENELPEPLAALMQQLQQRLDLQSEHGSAGRKTKTP